MIDPKIKAAAEAFARKEAEDAVRWVHTKLDEAFAAEFPDNRRMSDADWDKLQAWFADLGPEIYGAERGNFAPLRKKLPHLAHLLNPPLRGKPRKPRRKKFKDPPFLDFAVWAAKLIPDIWKGTEQKVAAHGYATTVQIAALWIQMRPPGEPTPVQVDVDDGDISELIDAIERRLKPSGKRR